MAYKKKPHDITNLKEKRRLTTVFVSTIKGKLLTGMRDIYREVIKSLKYDESTPSGIRGEKIKEGTMFVKKLCELSYKFSDVFFKSVSWLVSISLLSWLYKVTKFGIFPMLATIGDISFSAFIFSRIVFPARFFLRWFGWGEGRYRAWFAVISFGGVLFLSGTFTFCEVPVIVKKITYAVHNSEIVHNEKPENK